MFTYEQRAVRNEIAQKIVIRSSTYERRIPSCRKENFLGGVKNEERKKDMVLLVRFRLLGFETELIGRKSREKERKRNQMQKERHKKDFFFQQPRFYSLQMNYL